MLLKEWLRKRITDYDGKYRNILQKTKSVLSKIKDNSLFIVSSICAYHVCFVSELTNCLVYEDLNLTKFVEIIVS